jgi:hypothetical protein
MIATARMAEGEIRSMTPVSESELWNANREGVLNTAQQHLCKRDVTWTVVPRNPVSEFDGHYIYSSRHRIWDGNPKTAFEKRATVSIIC